MENQDTHSSQDHSEWEIPQQAGAEVRMFDFDKFYDPEEFMAILQGLIGDFLTKQDDPTYQHIIYVLEHWEKRVLDLIASTPEDSIKYQIGFFTGEDGITRIYTTVLGSDL